MDSPGDSFGITTGVIERPDKATGGGSISIEKGNFLEEFVRAKMYSDVSPTGVEGNSIL